MSNQKYYNYSNIINWHKSGYKGEKVVIGIEEINPDSEHAYMVRQAVERIAPKATIKMYRKGTSLDQYIKDGIHILNQSHGFSYSPNKKKIKSEDDYKKLVDAGITVVTSAGNYGKNTVWGTKVYPNVITVGAVNLRNNKVELESFSSTGEGIDLVNFNSLRVRKLNENRKTIFAGTSCSTPYTTGMLALWFEYMLYNHDYVPGFYESLNYLYDICKDLKEPGYDIKTGFGIPILPKIKKRELPIKTKKQSRIKMVPTINEKGNKVWTMYGYHQGREIDYWRMKE